MCPFRLGKVSESLFVDITECQPMLGNCACRVDNHFLETLASGKAFRTVLIVFSFLSSLSEREIAYHPFHGQVTEVERNKQTKTSATHETFRIVKSQLMEDVNILYKTLAKT